MTLPLDDPAYVQLSALERQGCAAARISPHRPYLVGAVREALGRAGSEPRCAGLLRDALGARFAPSGAPAVAAGARGDSLAVGQDLLSAVQETRASEARRDSQFTLGGAVTLRATGLGRGDFRPLWRDIAPTELGDPTAVGVLRLRGSWRGGPRLVAVAEAYGETNPRNDPVVRALAFRRTTGVVDFSEAYVSGRVGSVVVSFGRGREAWLGRDVESLILSANGPPLDRLEASAAGKHFEGRALVALLDDVVLDTLRDSLSSGTPPLRFQRWLVGHVLTWRPSRALELSLGETALLARSTGRPDLAFLNPLMVYLVTQNDAGHEADAGRNNITAFGAARAQFGGTTLTGELLVDDIQIDREDRKQVPDQLGWRLEATQAVPLSLPASVSLEYRRVDSYTYMRRFYTEVYQQFGRPLGSELGPDADVLRGGAELWIGGLARVSAGVGAWRRGALRIDRRPAQAAQGHAGEPFPSTSPSRPEVQRALLGDLTLQLLSARLPMTLRIEAASVDNVNNRAASATVHTRAQLVATYAFRYP